MTIDRTTFKRAITALLDAHATEHPIGHQNDKAARYIIAAPGGKSLEIMFQKDPKSPPNIWITERAAGPLVGGTIAHKRSPAALLWKKKNQNGELNYGRHSGLRAMPQLAEADLVCFAPASPAEVQAILYRLLNHSTSGR